MSERIEKVKGDLREGIRATRKALTPDQVRADSGRATDLLFELMPLEQAGVVGCYLALPREVQTDALIQRCRDLGKKICVPAEYEARRYRMAWLEHGEPLSRDSFGILQPAQPRWVDANAVQFLVVPGLAFDRTGRRLGHGGGHYDRMLDRCSCFKAGLAFQFQLVENVPLGGHDVPVDLVVTEQGIYPAGRAAGLKRGL